MLDHAWTQRAEAFFAGLVLAIYAALLAYGYADRFAWLKEWQTLISGIIATIAAFFSIAMIRNQMKHAETQVSRQLAHSVELEENRRKARNFAGRASIAQPLSNIIAVQRQITGHFADFWKSTLSVKSMMKSTSRHELTMRI